MGVYFGCFTALVPMLCFWYFKNSFNFICSVLWEVRKCLKQRDFGKPAIRQGSLQLYFFKEP